MEFAWIPLAVLAALMQAIRTAAQKTLNARMSTMGTTYVRSLAGLPFIALFLGAILVFLGGGVPRFDAAFLAYAFAGAASQVLATALLIFMFTLRSFAVGTMLIKMDILMTAAIGSVFFSERITGWGWVALIVVMAGVVLMLVGRLGTTPFSGVALRAALGGRVARVALACALMFTVSYLSIREATLALLPGNFLWRGTWTVFVVLGMQTLFLGAWLAAREPAFFRQLWPNRAIVAFIGGTSAIGSFGWFTAFALENASYVRAVGQIEAAFTVTISWFYFKERISAPEFAGIALMVAGVLLFRLG